MRNRRRSRPQRPRNAILSVALVLFSFACARNALAISPGCRYVNDHPVTFIYAIAHAKKLHAYSGHMFDEGDRINFVAKSPNSLVTLRFEATARDGALIARSPNEDGRASLILFESAVWEYRYRTPIRISVRFRVSCEPAGTWSPDDPSDDWLDDSGAADAGGE